MEVQHVQINVDNVRSYLWLFHGIGFHFNFLNHLLPHRR
jgi:hypothetical protein